MSTSEVISVDAHGHLYPCFDICTFLEQAHSNLSEAVTQISDSLRPRCVLFVLSTSVGNGFRRLRETFERRGVHDCSVEDRGWRVQATAERISMCLVTRDRLPLVIIAGRQIVSRGGLEVLALGTCQQFDDGQPTEMLIREIARAGAIPVLPWGVGKWLGRRGRVVEDLIENPALPPFFLGDNANRPALWPRPSQFRRAEERGIRNLPGSDPLPLPGESRRVGRFGATLVGSLSLQEPAKDLKGKILDPSTTLHHFGSGESPYRFLRNQALMQYHKLTR